MNLTLFKKKPLGNPSEYRIDSNISDKIIKVGVANKNKILKNEFNDLLKSVVFGSLINPGNECRTTMEIQKKLLHMLFLFFYSFYFHPLNCFSILK
ncbi:hypothetical protein SEQMU2_12190 [Staphylococcus equorum subsp. equorum Mu2]|nr:hypothetical protein SEQMU2_12190 [Staphylococcus equorum subsp. equorum Mu2]